MNSKVFRFKKSFYFEVIGTKYSLDSKSVLLKEHLKLVTRV